MHSVLILRDAQTMHISANVKYYISTENDLFQSILKFVFEENSNTDLKTVFTHITQLPLNFCQKMILY